MKVGIKEREEYSRWLKQMQRDLGFKNGELAEYAGVSLATAGKYLTGDSYPSSQHIKDRINEFIENFSVIEGFHRLENQEFCSKLSELVGAFNVSQDEIAEATGIPQPYISDYLSKNPKRRLTTATQYKIIKFFIDISQITRWKFKPQYEIQGKRISRLLNTHHNERPSRYMQNADNQAIEIKWAINNFSKLPLKIKRVIKENFIIFFWLDNAAPMGVSDSETLVRNFRRLNPDLQQMLIEKLKRFDNCILSPDNPHFKKIHSFFNLISASKEFPVLLKEKRRKKRTTEDDKLDEWFRKLIFTTAQYRTINWENIERKLTIDSEGWYFLMLLYIYDENGYSVSRVDSDIKKAIKKTP